MTSPCFGIDLGTTASAIAWVRDGKPTLLAVHGADLLPSALLVGADGALLVGQPALNALPLAPDRGVLSTKRHTGSSRSWNLGGRAFDAVDVAAELLRALCAGAEASCGVAPERVVITVPAWFTHAQRADTRRAGEAAGLDVVRVINEPTAAALAHAHGQALRRRVLVYDLGGGTFDVSLVEQDHDVVEVRASHGDTRLGGDDIDLALVDVVLRRIAERDAGLRDAIDGSAAARYRLRFAVEAAKRDLSSAYSTTLRVPFLVEVDGAPCHLEEPLDRDALDVCAAPFLERTLESVDAVLDQAGVRPGELDELLLVGGSTWMPAVWHLLHDRYGLEGSHAIDPRRVVALGAAIQGAIVDGSRTDGILLDVAPYALSAGAIEHLSPFEPPHFGCHVITPRNAPLPARHTHRFFTAGPMQEEVRIPVYQGAAHNPRRNVLLGEVCIGDLEPAPNGEETRPVLVEFQHDLDGLVTIVVTDELTGRAVDGRVAADGAAQEALHREVEARVQADGIVYGSAGGPFEVDDDGDSLGDLPSGDAAEARQTFHAVRDAATQLKQAHPDHAAELLSLASDGLDALERGDDPGAVELYDRLSDAMFHHGIYL